MRIIKPSVKLLHCPDEIDALELLETAGRACYKSAPGNNKKFIKNIIRSGHMSVIEHVHISVEIVCDRGVMAELTRHRLANYSVESTRYCNYSKGEFGNEITVIQPVFWEKGTPKYECWEIAMDYAEKKYLLLVKNGATAQEARAVLPNSLATTIIMTANLREFLHVLKLRTSTKAHPQMREVMLLLQTELRDRLPVIFGRGDNDKETQD